MTLYLFDAAFRPDLAACKQAGFIAGSVYLTGIYADTCAQPSELLAAGLGALANYEEGPAQLVTAGMAGGVAIGQRAAAAAIAKGFPADAGKGIAFSVDTNVAPADFPAVGASFEGIRQGVAGRFVVCAYGEGGVIDYLVAHHDVVPVDWLAAPSSWPGFSASDPNVAVVQLVGSPVADTDEDQITNLGALAPLIWWPVGSPYAQEDDVALTAEQAQALSIDTTHPDTVSLGAVYQKVSAMENDTTHADTLVSIRNDMDARFNQVEQQLAALATGPAPTVDYNQLAQALAPLLAQAVADHVKLTAQ